MSSAPFGQRFTVLITPQQVRTTTFILISVFLHAFAFFTGTFYLPVYYQVLGASATMSGVRYVDR